MSHPAIQPARSILLTGAGFTKSFKGYLASEMWALIFNHPDIVRHPRLRQYLLENFDYEEVWDRIEHNEEGFLAEERRAYVVALENAYEHLHIATCGSLQSDVCKYCRFLLSRFGRVEQDEIGLIFTLNHDLLLEQHFSQDNIRISIPGLHDSTWFRGKKLEKHDAQSVKLPKEDEVAKLDERFWSTKNQQLAYIKLHGSLGWKSTYGYDSRIVGTTKASAIDHEPLLKWNFSVLKKALHAGDRNLLIIGYGFRDPHINQVIADGILKHGLKMFIVNPCSPPELYAKLVGYVVGDGSYSGDLGSLLWSGLAGYFMQTADQLVPRSDFDVLSSEGEMLVKRMNLLYR